MDKLIFGGCVLLFGAGLVFGAAVSVHGSDFWVVKLPDLINLLSATATATGVAVAYFYGRKGLHLWRQQLQGSSEHELAKRLVVSISKYKDHFKHARWDFIPAAELTLSDTEKAGLDEAHQSFYGAVKAYERRYDRLCSVSSEMQPDVVLAELIWGDQISGMFSKLYDLQVEFGIALQSYAKNNRPGLPEHIVRSRLEANENDDRRVLSDFDGQGSFSVELNSVIDSLRGMIEGKYKAQIYN